MLLKKNIPPSYIIQKVKSPAFFIIIYAFIIYLLKSVANFKSLSIPITIPSILGTTISLLLAFRTNQSYGRWWEARTLWGAIVNDSRTLARQLISFTKYNENSNSYSANIVRTVVHRQIAWNYILANTLREQPLPDNIDNLLSDTDKNLIEVSSHKNNTILHLHANDIQKLLDDDVITNHQFQSLDNTLTSLCNSMGGCERIKNTVFPTMFSIFINIFVYLFALSLPLGLIDVFGISEIPLTALTVASFFMIERSCIDLQNPFNNKPTDTPVTSISRNIEINLRQMIGEDKLPKKIEAESFYIM